MCDVTDVSVTGGVFEVAVCFVVNFWLLCGALS